MAPFDGDDDNDDGVGGEDGGGADGDDGDSGDEDLNTFKRLIKSWYGPSCRCNFCNFANDFS